MSGSSMNHELCALTPGKPCICPRLKGLCCTPCCRCHGATRGQQAGPNCIQQPGRCVLCVLLLDFEVAILLKELGAEADDASHLQANEIRTNTLGNYIWNQNTISRIQTIWNHLALIFHKDKVSPANSRQVFRHSVPRPGPGFPSLTAATVQGLEKCLRPGIEVLQRPM